MHSLKWLVPLQEAQIRILDILSQITQNNPWMNTYIKHLSRGKQHAYNQAHITNESQHWTKYYNTKRECQWECCTAYNKHVANLVDLNKN